jgi:tRNA dimethylallyltransferase
MIFLMGPTAIGKTQLAIALAASDDRVELISVDSAMVYRGMDIGTGKPSAEEQIRTPHHLINIREPTDTYSAADFAHDARIRIADILARNKIPVLVGGTGLYFRALEQGLAILPVAHPSIRAALLEEAQHAGWPALHAQLAACDPASFAKIHPNDAQRIQRALEVYRITGKSISALWQEQICEQRWDQKPQYFALVPETETGRAALHQRIEIRFHEMLKQGFIEEVEAVFLHRQLPSTLPALRSVGYRQIYAYLSGECTKDEMIQGAIAATRQLAKRQLTWIRGLKEVNLLLPGGGCLDSLKSMVGLYS